MGFTDGPEYGGPVASVAMLMPVRCRRRETLMCDGKGVLSDEGRVNPFVLGRRLKRSVVAASDNFILTFLPNTIKSINSLFISDLSTGGLVL